MITARLVRGVVLSWVAAALAACGTVQTSSHDAPPRDGPDVPIDGPDIPPMDGPDDPPPAPQLTSAGGTLRGPTFTLDVQLGHGWAQSPTGGSTFQLESRPAIAP